jgi:hypothetical protein
LVPPQVSSGEIFTVGVAVDDVVVLVLVEEVVVVLVLVEEVLVWVLVEDVLVEDVHVGVS